MDESGVDRLDALQPNIEAAEILQVSKSVEQQVRPLQGVTATPLSIFEDRHELENGFGTVRETKISPLENFQARMLSADSQWACHPSYIFWACNIVEALKLQSSISVAMRMRSFTEGHSTGKKTDKKTEDIRLLTAGALRGRLETILTCVKAATASCEIYMVHRLTETQSRPVVCNASHHWSWAIHW